jgi:hypothetical protein
LLPGKSRLPELVNWMHPEQGILPVENVCGNRFVTLLEIGQGRRSGFPHKQLRRKVCIACSSKACQF